MADPPFYLRTGTSGEQVVGTPGNVLTIMADGERVQGQPPSGGGGALVNLYNTVWVDKNTTVLPANQTGNIEAPFDSLADARTALIALGNGDEKQLVVMPGDYSAEPNFAWDSTADGRLHIINGSWLSMQQQQSIQNVYFPTIDFPGGLGGGLNNITGIGFLGDVTGNAALNLTSCQQLAGTFTGDRIDATNCYLNGAMTLSGSGHIFRQCATGDIDLSANEADLQFQDCVPAGDITWLGDPGEALFDDTSLRWLIATGKTLVNGTARLSRPPSFYMSANTDPVGTFDTSGDSNFHPLIANIANFTGNSASGFAIGANGVVTYTGPKRFVVVRAQFCISNPNAANIATVQFGISQNGDLNGLAIADAAALIAGASYAKLTNEDQQTIAVMRMVTLSSGDTLSPSCAASNTAGTDMELTSGSMTIEPI